MNEWQPIETAPKDGSRILVFADDDIYIVRWGMSEPFGEAKTWTTDSEGPGYSSEYEPTHWMPLPEPPPPKEGE